MREESSDDELEWLYSAIRNILSLQPLTQISQLIQLNKHKKNT